MSRFYKNEFYYDSYGEKYRKKTAWTPENEEYFYKDFGGVPYNPQFDSYDNEKFLRRHRLGNTFRIYNNDDNRPDQGNDGNVHIYREPIQVPRVNLNNVENVNRQGRDQEIIRNRRNIIRRRNSLMPIARRRRTVELDQPIEDNNQRRDTIDLELEADFPHVPSDDHANIIENVSDMQAIEMDNALPHVPNVIHNINNNPDNNINNNPTNNQRTVVRVPSYKKLRSWNADNPLENKVLRVRRRKSGTVEINPRLRHKIRIERVGRVKQKGKVNPVKALGRNEAIKQKVREWKNMQNYKAEIKKDILDNVNPQLQEIRDRIGTEFMERDKIMQDNLNKFMEYNLKGDNLTRQDVEQMIFNSFDLDSIFNTVENLIGFKRITVKRTLESKFKKPNKLDKEEVRYKTLQEESDHEKFTNFKKELKNKNIPYQQKLNEVYAYGLRYLRDQMESLKKRTNSKLTEYGKTLTNEQQVINELRANNINIQSKFNELSRVQNLMAREQTVQAFREEMENRLNNLITREQLDQLKEDFTKQMLEGDSSISVPMKKLEEQLKGVYNKNEITELIDAGIKKSVSLTKNAVQSALRREVAKINEKASSMMDPSLLLGFINDKEKYKEKFRRLMDRINIQEISLKGLEDLFNEFNKTKYVSKPMFDEEIELIKKNEKDYKEKMAVLEGRFSEFGLELDKLKKHLEKNPDDLEDFDHILAVLEKNHEQVSKTLLQDFMDTMERTINKKDFMPRKEMTRYMKMLYEMAEKRDKRIEPSATLVNKMISELEKTNFGKVLRSSFDREPEFTDFVKKAIRKGDYKLLIAVNNQFKAIGDNFAQEVFNTVFDKNSKGFKRLNNEIMGRLNVVTKNYNNEIGTLRAAVEGVVNGNADLFKALEQNKQNLLNKLAMTHVDIRRLQIDNRANLENLNEIRNIQKSLRDKIDMLNDAAQYVYSKDLNKMERNIKTLQESADKFARFYSFISQYPGEVVDEDFKDIKNTIEKWKESALNDLKPFVIQLQAVNNETEKEVWMNNFLTNAKNASPEFARNFARMVGASLANGTIFFDPSYNPFEEAKKKLVNHMNQYPEKYANVINSPDGSMGRLMLSNFISDILETMKQDVSPAILEYVYNNLTEDEKESAKVIGLTRNILKAAMIDAAGKSMQTDKQGFGNEEFRKVVEKTIDSLPVFKELDNSIKEIHSGRLIGKHKYPRKMVFHPGTGERMWIEDEELAHKMRIEERREKAVKMLSEAIEDLWKYDPADVNSYSVEKVENMNRAIEKMKGTAVLYADEVGFPDIARQVTEDYQLQHDPTDVEYFFNQLGLPDLYTIDQGEWYWLWNPKFEVPVGTVRKNNVGLFKKQPFMIEWKKESEPYDVSKEKRWVFWDPENPNNERRWTFYDSPENKARRATSDWYEKFGKYNVNEMSNLQLLPFANVYQELMDKENSIPEYKPEGSNIQIINPPKGFYLNTANGKLELTTKEGKPITIDGNIISMGVPKNKKYFTEYYNNYEYETRPFMKPTELKHTYERKYKLIEDKVPEEGNEFNKSSLSEKQEMSKGGLDTFIKRPREYQNKIKPPINRHRGQAGPAAKKPHNVKYNRQKNRNESDRVEFHQDDEVFDADLDPVEEVAANFDQPIAPEGYQFDFKTGKLVDKEGNTYDTIMDIPD